jgi:hypothetical protein
VVLHLPHARPYVPASPRCLKEVRRLIDAHARWLGAELPADAFAAHQQQLVGDALTRATGALIGGSHWLQLERKLEAAREPADYLDQMQNAIGGSRVDKELASVIAFSLYKWLTPGQLLPGFTEAIWRHPAIRGSRGQPAMPLFLLVLASRPGRLAGWDDKESTLLLDGVLQSPVLYRAARFAVLGTRTMSHADSVDWGF